MYLQYDQRLNYPRSLIIIFIFHILDSTIHPVPLNRFSRDDALIRKHDLNG